MIVRLMGEGQYRIGDDVAERLNELDNAAVAAVERRDESQFLERFGQLVALIRAEGDAVGDDELEPSDVLIPPADTTFAEAVNGEAFTGEGLIPD